MSMRAHSAHWLRERAVWRWASASISVRGGPAAPAALPDDASLPSLPHPVAVSDAIRLRKAGRRTLRTRWRSLSLATRVSITLLSIAAVYRLVLIFHGWPGLDSDEAIIGLMARHILNNGERPVFFYGQEYMGAFQAYFAAALFAVFGSSAFTLHIGMLLLTLGFLAAMYGLGRATYGPVVGVLTLAWLTIGPPMGVLRELMATGGYQEMLLFASLVLFLVWLRLREPTSLPHSRRGWTRYLLTYGAMGVLGGLALWSDLLVVPVLLLAGAALVLGRTREVFHIGGIVLALAFCFGASPYIVYNLTHFNATYLQVARQSHPPGREQDLPTLAEWRDQSGETLAVALPTILGSPRVCVNHGNVWETYPPVETQISRVPIPACDAANMTLSLGVIAVYLFIAWQLLVGLWLWARGVFGRRQEWRDWLGSLRTIWPREGDLAKRRRILIGRLFAFLRTMPRAPTADETSEQHAMRVEMRARLWLRAMMLGIGAMTLVVYTSSVDAQRFQFTSARYLLPLYLAAPLLFGCLWSFARPLVVLLLAELQRQRLADGIALVSLAAMARARRARLATVALAVLFVCSVGGGGLTVAHASAPDQYGLPASPGDTRLEAFLSQHHISAFYADYWTCYRLVFESGERLTCAVRGQNGDIGLELINNRYDPYVRALAATAHPAYVLPAGTDQDRDFAQEALIEQLPHAGYVRVTFEGYAIYYYAPKTM